MLPSHVLEKTASSPGRVERPRRCSGEVHTRPSVQRWVRVLVWCAVTQETESRRAPSPSPSLIVFGIPAKNAFQTRSGTGL